MVLVAQATSECSVRTDIYTEWTNNKKVGEKDIHVYKRMKIKWKHKKKHYKRLFPSYIEDCGDTQKEFPTLFKKGGGCGAGKWFLTGLESCSLQQILVTPGSHLHVEPAGNFIK